MFNLQYRDHDRDGILSKYEYGPDFNAEANDTDEDGIPDYIDVDDDGDGHLTKNYLNSSNLDNLKSYLFENDKSDNFPTDLFAFSEITALRLNIPKQPSFIFTENEMINLSLNTFVNNPNEFYKIDVNNQENTRNEILKSFGVKLTWFIIL